MMVRHTPIPRRGWQEEDIGREVILRFPHGTLMPDVITAVTLSDGKQVIGPATEIGMIEARVGIAIPLIMANDIAIMNMDDNTYNPQEEEE